MKRNNINIILVIALVLLAASTRIINHEMHLHNFAPLAAIGLFSGAIIRDKRLFFLAPVLGQFIADIYFQLFTATAGFYDISQLFTYGGLFAAAYLGTLFTKPNAVNALAYTFGASTLFFLVSNFGVWLAGWYGRSFDALVKTYVMGLPFFKYTLAGDMAGGILLFGTYFLVQNSLAAKAQKA